MWVGCGCWEHGPVVGCFLVLDLGTGMQDSSSPRKARERKSRLDLAKW